MISRSTNSTANKSELSGNLPSRKPIFEETDLSKELLKLEKDSGLSSTLGRILYRNGVPITRLPNRKLVCFLKTEIQPTRTTKIERHSRTVTYGLRAELPSGAPPITHIPDNRGIEDTEARSNLTVKHHTQTMVPYVEFTLEVKRVPFAGARNLKRVDFAFKKLAEALHNFHMLRFRQSEALKGTLPHYDKSGRRE